MRTTSARRSSWHPVSRYAIIIGKLVGETLVALPQGLAVIAFGFVLGVGMSAGQLLGLAAAGVVICLFGGAFGLLVLSNLSSQRAAQQIFPFVLLPQFFLAGVFNPIHVLPWYLEVLSRISPMRYAVDFARSIFYSGRPEIDRVVLDGLPANIAVIAGLSLVFVVAGTFLFVRAERNR